MFMFVSPEWNIDESNGGNPSAAQAVIQRSGFALVPPDVLVERPASLSSVSASRAAIML
jgi:hypothetical protein